MKLAIGTANFNNRYGQKKILLNKEKVFEILSSALKLKIKYLDTAFNYGDSLALLSKFNLNYFKVSSKFKIKKKNINFYIKDIEKKIDLLKINQFQDIMIHNFYELNRNDLIEVLPLLRMIKKRNFAKKIGISVYDPEELKKTWDIWRPDSVQLPLNILDRRFLKSGWIRKLHLNKIQVHARSIFLQGILVDDNFLSRDERLTDINYSFSKWTKVNNISKYKACINFIKNIKEVDRIIFGVENHIQLCEFNENFLSKDTKYPKNIYSNNKNIIDPRRW